MLFEICTLIFLCIGIFGVFLPMFPGISLMFVVTFVYGFASNFERMEPWHLWIFAGITALSLLIDWSAGILGAKFGGASTRSMLAGLGGMIIGLVFFPPIGAILGLFAGVFLSEVARHRTGEQAFKSATSSLIATAGGIVANIVLACVYVATFAIIVFI